MKIIFAGTPDFSATILKTLITAGHNIVCAYTQPDRKTGRGQKVLPPVVKVCALENDIPVLQPTSLKTAEALAELESFDADLMVVVAYGLLLPQAVLDAPKFGCLNIHASLLPRWRGAAPIQRAIESQDAKTGICIMQMEAGLDTGPVLAAHELTIETTDTSASLHDKLATLGSEAILNSLENLAEQQKNAIPQEHDKANYAHKISKQEANIDWSLSAKAIDHKIRAFIPWPICQTFHKEQRLRIWEASTCTDKTSNATAGEIIGIDKTGIEVACGEGVIKLQKLQKDGSKPLAANDFLNGSTLAIGDSLGSS